MIQIAVKKTSRKAGQTELERAFAQFEEIQRQIKALNHQKSLLEELQKPFKEQIENACYTAGGDLILGHYRAKMIPVGERLVRPYSYVRIST